MPHLFIYTPANEHFRFFLLLQAVSSVHMSKSFSGIHLGRELLKVMFRKVQFYKIVPLFFLKQLKQFKHWPASNHSSLNKGIESNFLSFCQTRKQQTVYHFCIAFSWLLRKLSIFRVFICDYVSFKTCLFLSFFNWNIFIVIELFQFSIF